MSGLLLWLQIFELPVKILAVLGAFALGAMVSGGLLRLIVKLAFKRQVPPLVLWFIRTLSGVVFAWLTALMLFGGGGSGIGGPGGLGTGTEGNGKDTQGPVREKDRQDKDKDDKDTDGKAKSAEILSIEVLGEVPVKKIIGKGAYEKNRIYRIRDEGNKLRTLDEVKQLARERLQGKPPLRRVDIIVYLDSPDLARPQVDDLFRWAQDLKDREKGRLMVDLIAPDRNAPVD